MKKNSNNMTKKQSQINTKSNGDIYDYDPIKGFNVTEELYDTEVADQPIFESDSINQTLEDTLVEKVNNNSN